MLPDQYKPIVALFATASLLSGVKPVLADSLAVLLTIAQLLVAACTILLLYRRAQGQTLANRITKGRLRKR